VQAKLNDALSEMTSATGILGSSDIAREMQQRVDEVNRVVKEQQEKLQALQADLTAVDEPQRGAPGRATPVASAVLDRIRASSHIGRDPTEW